MSTPSPWSLVTPSVPPPTTSSGGTSLPPISSNPSLLQTIAPVSVQASGNSNPTLTSTSQTNSQHPPLFLIDGAGNIIGGVGTAAGNAASSAGSAIQSGLTDAQNLGSSAVSALTGGSQIVVTLYKYWAIIVIAIVVLIILFLFRHPETVVAAAK